MGFEIELFVYPDRISSQLICPICTSVLERPVQTPSEHLFCEDELLEWMTRSQMCPVTNTRLDPDTIKKPGRIIINMLSELEMYCPNKVHGCQWIGSCDQVINHKKKCNNRSKEELLQEIEKKDTIITKLKQKLSTSEEKIIELQERNAILVESNEELQIINRRLKVYDAFFKNNNDDRIMVKEDDDDKQSTTMQELSRLRRLNLMEEKISEISDDIKTSKLVDILSDSKE